MTRRIVKLSAVGALLALPLLASCAYTPSIPAFDAPVVDSANIVDQATEQSLNTLLEDFRSVKGPQIAVLTVSSTGSQTIENFAIDVAREWAVGDAERDDGVLLVVAYDDRTLRIETGSGIEGELTDVQTAAVIEKMKPALRELDPSRAVSVGVSGIIAALTGTAVTPGDYVGPGADTGVTTAVAPNQYPIMSWFLMFLPFAIFAVLQILAVVARGDRRVGGSSWWGSGGGFVGSSSNGGFSSGGGFSGGGGGFSGGGSSGSW